METWLSPFCSVWKRQFPDAAIPYKQLAQTLKPLLKAHAADRVALELSVYLKETPARFLNLAKFAMAFGSWFQAPKPQRPYTQTADEADRRAGIPLQ